MTVVKHLDQTTEVAGCNPVALVVSSKMMSISTGRAPERSAKIFISYRRVDSSGYAGRLFADLTKRFPKSVFMDIDTIEPGSDFIEFIKQAVASCEVMIVLIGRDWLGTKDAAGHLRLADPRDLVHLEVATALERGIRVIPVLVQKAAMPHSEQLPPQLTKLAERNAIELSDTRWPYDVDRLIRTLERLLGSNRSTLRTARVMQYKAWLGIVIVVVIGVGSWLLLRTFGASMIGIFHGDLSRGQGAQNFFFRKNDVPDNSILSITVSGQSQAVGLAKKLSVDGGPTFTPSKTIVLRSPHIYSVEVDAVPSTAATFTLHAAVTLPEGTVFGTLFNQQITLAPGEIATLHCDLTTAP